MTQYRLAANKEKQLYQSVKDQNEKVQKLTAAKGLSILFSTQKVSLALQN